jgi:hypothetical protein
VISWQRWLVANGLETDRARNRVEPFKLTSLERGTMGSFAELAIPSTLRRYAFALPKCDCGFHLLTRKP